MKKSSAGKPLVPSVVDQGIIKFDRQFVGPFIDAVQATLATMAQASSVYPEPSFMLGKDQHLGVDISGTIAINSPGFRGALSLCFPKDTFLAVASRMLSEDYKEITADIKDAAGELTNIVFGDSKRVLEQHGYQLEKALPSIIDQANHRIEHPAGGPILIIPLQSDLGRLFLQICLFEDETVKVAQKTPA